MWNNEVDARLFSKGKVEQHIYYSVGVLKTSDAFADLSQGFPLNSDTVSEGVSDGQNIDCRENRTDLAAAN